MNVQAALPSVTARTVEFMDALSGKQLAASESREASEAAAGACRAAYNAMLQVRSISHQEMITKIRAAMLIDGGANSQALLLSLERDLANLPEHADSEHSADVGRLGPFALSDFNAPVRPARLPASAIAVAPSRQPFLPPHNSAVQRHALMTRSRRQHTR
jgi:hypothetical protein